MTNSHRRAVAILAFAGLLTGGAVAGAQDAPLQPAPDNTRVNERDRQASEATADKQGNSRSDVDTTKEIRQSIRKDKALSTYAQNVKVITQDGMVTLKGPVRSEEEKQAIEAKAAEIVGQDKVVSELAVQPKQ
jgi:osmotically-inducible protein OsmY